MPSSSAPARRRLPLRRVALAAAAVAGLFLLGRELGGRLPGFVNWVERLGAWAPAAFIGGYALATVLFVPGWLLSLAAGVLFGVVGGTIYTFAGAAAGSSAAFLIARYLARDSVARRVAADARFAALDRAVGREGRRLVFLLRLSPLFPYNLLNYGLGLTQVRFRDYLAASVGMIPATAVYVYTGYVIGDLAMLAAGAETVRGAGYYAVLVLGLVATVLVTWRVTRIARRALREAV